MAVTLSKTSAQSAQSEAQLVAAARAGDDRAFEALYSLYRERIFGFILKRVRDHGRAEDIVQDVFISALRRLRASDQEISFKPWIYEIAKNACIDEFRRGSRGREVPLGTDSELPADQPTTLSVLPTPVAAVESKQRMNDLRGAFGGLSENHHQLLVMREFEGRSYEEIGERLDMTRQMVESGLFRARRKLTEEYHELASGRRCQQVQLAIDTGAMSSARALGLRDRRRFARHLSHCQVCRNVALQSDVDEALVAPRRIAAKIAALLPFPLWRLSGAGHGRRAARAAARRGSQHLTSGSLHGAAGLAEPAGGSALTLGPAAVAAAALTIAGVGGTLLHGAIEPGHPARPMTAVPAAAISPAVPRATTRPASSSATAGLVVPAQVSEAARAAHAAARISFSTSVAHPRRETAARHHAAPAATGSHAPGTSTGSGTSGAARSSVTTPAPAPATSLSVASAVGATTHDVVSTAQHAVSTVTQAAPKAAGQLATGAGKTIASLQNAAAGPPPPATPTASPGTTSSTSPLSTVVQGAQQAVSQAAQALLPSK